MNKPVTILSFTLLVVMLGYGMVLPVLPFLIEKLGAGGSEMGWLMSSYSLMQFIFAPIWGSVSDRIGRKPVLVLGILGYAISLFMFGLAQSFTMMFIARVFSGVLSCATMPTAMAYIGDQVSEEGRSAGMGKLGAAMGIGVVLGPIIGGLLSKDSISLPFFIGSGLAVLAALLVLLIVPASRAEQKSTAGDGNRNPILGFSRFSAIAGGAAGILLLLIFIMSFALANFQGIISLYVVDKLHLQVTQVGIIWMLLGGVMVVAQGVLTGPLSKRFGEVMLIRMGLIGGVMGLLGMSKAGSFFMVMVALGLFSLSLAVMTPALNARLTRFGTGQQGALMGMNSAISSLGRVVGPLWAGYLYDLNYEFPFISGAVILAIGSLISYFWVKEVG